MTRCTEAACAARRRSTRRLALALLLAGVAPASRSGPASLPAGDLPALRALVRDDPGARLRYAELKTRADRAMTRPPSPVPVIVSAGKLESDPLKVESTRGLQDLDAAEALAWVWAVDGDARAAGQARDLILAWAELNRSDGHPINETKFEPLIVAYDLLREGFDPAARRTVDDWLRAKAQAAWASKRNRDQNYQSHRIKVVALVGLALDDPALIDTALRGFRRQVQANLRPDGSSVDFERRDALHYHLYDVKPLLRTACAFAFTGKDLYHEPAAGGISLERALAFLVPYTDGVKTHVEFAQSSVAFDLTRARHGERAYQPHPWDPRRAVEVYSLAGCFDPAYPERANRLAGIPGSAYVDWRAVLNAASTRRGVK